MNPAEARRARASRELRVGLLLLAAVGVLAAGIFLIGEQNNLFRRKNRYWVNFESVSGVKPGNPVQLDGVDVGTVEEVILPRDPEQKFIRVWINVDRRYAERIRAPRTMPASKADRPVWTTARIKTLGLLGDKYVELTSGAPAYPAIATGEQIPSAEPTNVDALIASGEDVMGNVVEISASLSSILARMEQGEGLLGELTTDSESGRRLRESMVSSMERIERIAAKVETGEGALPRLLNDPVLANRLASSVDRFETLLATAQSGEGLLPALLNDPSAKQSFDQTLATLNQVARDLQVLTADLDQSEALLPRLLKDEEYGRELTGEVRQIVERLSSVADKLDRGDGTAAQLINDPQIYDAVNDVIIGINESRLLRWLIRNRQKAGIEKRYEDAMKELGGGSPGPEGEPGSAAPPEGSAAPPEGSAEPPEGSAEPPGGGEEPGPGETAEPPPGGQAEETAEPALPEPGKASTTDAPDASDASDASDEPTSTAPPPPGGTPPVEPPAAPAA